ncbi:MAG: hypothetical protein JYX80_05305 [Candidatus Scalindua sediminis]|nr:hypothetical protein [Candidatus Scalindua sediminis]
MAIRLEAKGLNIKTNALSLHVTTFVVKTNRSYYSITIIEIVKAALSG